MENISLEKIKKIHFIGAGGIGLSAIAKLMKKRGKKISGSDLSASLVIDDLKKRGIKIYIGQSEKNISEDLDLVIYTTAVPKNNPELQKARKLKIRAITYPQFLGLIFNNKFGIAVCGTHGKSSTTAMAGLLLDDAGFDPSIIVGSIVPRYKSNLRVGESKYFLIEACEYERAFLNYYPKIIVLNNIELDHTDYYKDIEDYKSAFEEFIKHLSGGGLLIFNDDDHHLSQAKYHWVSEFESLNIKVLSFGLQDHNDLRGYDIEMSEGKTKFKVNYRGKEMGEFILKIPGLFNVYNSLAVISLGIALNIPNDIIKKSLENYSGIWRRFEIKGEYKNVLVISDYAHHPTAVRLTIGAVKKFYPGRRIFAVFQPHQHNRTKVLYKDFLKSFDDADVVIFSEIFDVAGREEKEDQNINSQRITEDVKRRLSNNIFPLKKRVGENSRLTSENIFYAKDLEKTRKLIDEKIKPDDILLIMGAGDIYKIADDLIKNK